MDKRNWDELLDGVIDTEDGALSNSSGVQDVLRREVLRELSTRINPLLEHGRKNHRLVSDEVNKALDAVLRNASRDGVDIDSELMEYLVELSGSLHAVESTWHKIMSLTSM